MSNDPKDMVELASFPEETLGQLAVSLLTAEGIPAACLGGHIKNTNLFFALGLPIKVVVRRCDLDRAKEVLAEQTQPPGWEDEAERMPREDE